MAYYLTPRDYGTVDCPYCQRRGVPKKNAGQKTCGSIKCMDKHRNEHNRTKHARARRRVA